MRRFKWYIFLGISSIGLSVLLYLINYVFCGAARHIFLYLIGDIAFLPIQFLLLTLIVNQLLSRREKRVMLNKLNMVIGAFFSEVGTGLLKIFIKFGSNS